MGKNCVILLITMINISNNYQVLNLGDYNYYHDVCRKNKYTLIIDSNNLKPNHFFPFQPEESKSTDVKY